MQYVSVFKTCGVYLFDLKAVLDHDPCNQVTSQTSGILMQSDTKNSAIAQTAIKFTLLDITMIVCCIRVFGMHFWQKSPNFCTDDHLYVLIKF